MIEGRKRGVIFDVGHGGGSFAWRVAVPAMKQGFLPDSISTDLHIGSMNSGMKDMLNVMDKFLAMGMSLDDVIARSTWNPAKEIHHEELGNLSVGAPADVTVLRVENGKFGFTDMYGARLDGKQRLDCELTLRDGKVVYDLNGITRPEWTTLPKDYTQVGRCGMGRDHSGEAEALELHPAQKGADTVNAGEKFASWMKLTRAEVCFALVTSRSAMRTGRGSSVSVLPACVGNLRARGSRPRAPPPRASARATALISNSSTCPFASASSVSCGPVTASPPAR